MQTANDGLRSEVTLLQDNITQLQNPKIGLNKQFDLLQATNIQQQDDDYFLHDSDTTLHNEFSLQDININQQNHIAQLHDQLKIGRNPSKISMTSTRIKRY